MKKRYFIIGLLIVAGLLVYFTKPNLQAAEDKSVAVVNGVPVLTADYDKNIKNLLNNYQQKNPNVLAQPYAEDLIGKQLLSEMVIREVLLQDAKKSNITASEEEVSTIISNVKANFKKDKDGKELTAKEQEVAYKKALKDGQITEEKFQATIKDNIILEKYKRAVLATYLKPVTEAEVKTFYDNVNAIYSNNTKKIEELKKTPAMYQEALVVAERLKVTLAPTAQAQIILVVANKGMSKEELATRKDLAKEISKEISSGADFSKEGIKYASMKGQNIFYSTINVYEGMNPKKLVSKILSLKVNKISEPIEVLEDNPQQNVAQGFFLAKVIAKEDGKKFTYEMSSKELENYINAKRAENIFAQIATAGLKNSEIKINKTFAVDKVLAEQNKNNVNNVPATEAK